MRIQAPRNRIARSIDLKLTDKNDQLIDNEVAHRALACI